MDQPRLTDQEFKALIDRVKAGVVKINEVPGGFFQKRRGHPFDPRRSGPPYTDIENWIVVWYELWDQMSDEANRRFNWGVTQEVKQDWPWPQPGKVGGGRQPNEPADEYILRMRSILYPKKGGRRKKHDSNRQNGNTVRNAPLFTEGD